MEFHGSRSHQRIHGVARGAADRADAGSELSDPFNPTTTIRFGLPEAGEARVVIFDLLGRRVETLVDRSFAAGWHTVSWDASAHASSVYVYTVETDHRRASKTLLLVK